MPRAGPGQRFGGRKKGSQNKISVEYKQAVINLLNYAAPQMVDWLERIATEDPDRALSHVEKFGEHILPKLTRAELTGNDGGPVKYVFGWDDT